jgi:hypothetical protein
VKKVKLLRTSKGTGVSPKALAFRQRHWRFAKGTGVSPKALAFRRSPEFCEFSTSFVIRKFLK